jgi:hypothetical protein
MLHPRDDDRVLVIQNTYAYLEMVCSLLTLVRTLFLNMRTTLCTAASMSTCDKVCPMLLLFRVAKSSKLLMTLACCKPQ